LLKASSRKFVFQTRSTRDSEFAQNSPRKSETDPCLQTSRRATQLSLLTTCALGFQSVRLIGEVSVTAFVLLAHPTHDVFVATPLRCSRVSRCCRGDDGVGTSQRTHQAREEAALLLPGPGCATRRPFLGKHGLLPDGRLDRVWAKDPGAGGVYREPRRIVEILSEPNSMSSGTSASRRALT